MYILLRKTTTTVFQTHNLSCQHNTNSDFSEPAFAPSNISNVSSTSNFSKSTSTPRDNRKSVSAKNLSNSIHPAVTSCNYNSLVSTTQHSDPSHPAFTSNDSSRLVSTTSAHKDINLHHQHNMVQTFISNTAYLYISEELVCN